MRMPPTQNNFISTGSTIVLITPPLRSFYGTFQWYLCTICNTECTLEKLSPLYRMYAYFIPQLF